jgi:hypothetical protein
VRRLRITIDFGKVERVEPDAFEYVELASDTAVEEDEPDEEPCDRIGFRARG